MTLQSFRGEHGVGRRTRGLVAALAIVCCAGVCASVLVAQQPQTARPQDEFVPVTELPQKDQLPAAPLLVAAYIVVWLTLLVYLWTIWRRLGKVDRELSALTRRLSEQEPHARR